MYRAAEQRVLAQIVPYEAAGQRGGVLTVVENTAVHVSAANMQRPPNPASELDVPAGPQANSVPASNFSVFVGKFHDIDPEELRRVFEQRVCAARADVQFGPVIRVRPFNGHCFVDFKDDASLNKALKNRTYTVGDHQITISPAIRSKAR